VEGDATSGVTTAFASPSLAVLLGFGKLSNDRYA